MRNPEVISSNPSIFTIDSRFRSGIWFTFKACKLHRVVHCFGLFSISVSDEGGLFDSMVNYY